MESVRKLLVDKGLSSVRLVVNAERMVIAEARRTYTYLNLFGYPVDAVICNRLIPQTVTERMRLVDERAGNRAVRFGSQPDQPGA